jgi:L-aspartate oxidase
MPLSRGQLLQRPPCCLASGGYAEKPRPGAWHARAYFTSFAAVQRYTDFLVIGSGVAGLVYALKAARQGKVLLMTKAQKEQSNTSWAQGGIAGVVSDADSFEQHINDTLVAGAGLCDEEIVRMVVEEGPARIRELQDWGVPFDVDDAGTLILGREGGHTANRILHHRDATGKAIATSLLEAVAAEPHIELNENLLAVDLLTQHHLGRYVNKGHRDITCYGVYALDDRTRQVHTVLSKVTVLATGGAGNVYAATTNPPVATGDGIAMAYRAKALVANMEFIQFHPTSFYDPGAQPAFLITEALRGKGAYLRNSYSRARFMAQYDARAELAPRDVVARAIDQELKHSGTDYVLLDATHLPAGELKQEFPTIYEHCRRRGVDLTQEPIPVRPAAHYTCGGIQVDAQGRSSIDRLYAIGECSATGLHGANRLASNSLLEGVVYAHRAAIDAARQLPRASFQEGIPPWDESATDHTEEWVLISHNRQELQNLMSNYVGIVRSNLRLERVARRLDLIFHETEDFYRRTRLSPELCELRNLITCAYLTTKSAALRQESRGLHYNTDYPRRAKEAFDLVL